MSFKLLPGSSFHGPSGAAKTIAQTLQFTTDSSVNAIEEIQEEGLNEYLDQGLQNFGENVSMVASATAQKTGELIASGIEIGAGFTWDIMKPILTNNWFFIILGLIFFGSFTYLLLKV